MQPDSSATRDGTATVESPWTHIGIAASSWFLRWKLTWVLSDIDEVERRLNDEFGLAETEPLTREHIALIRERDALMRRLTNPYEEPVPA